MKLLELFSGTGSMGRSFEERGWEITSLDSDPTSGAGIVTNFMDWDFAQFEPGHFDAIWASPPCTHYSVARTTAKTPRDLEGSDNLVQRVLDCIDYLQPRVWAFENPQTGLLKTRQVVYKIPFKDVSYCKYGYPYKKATRIWTNSASWAPVPMCCKQSPCEGLVDGRHDMTAQRGPCRRGGVLATNDKCSLQQLYSIPKGLCDEIAEAFGRVLVASV